MKTIKQLARQPLKTLSGIVLMTLAVAILCVSVGQALAVRTTEETLNQQFSTVAIPQEKETAPYLTLDAELMDWLEETAQENPDVIKQVARHGLLSASIPELTPLNITSEKFPADNIEWEEYRYYNTSDGYRPQEVTLANKEYYTYLSYQAEPYNMPYSCAMLVITLEEVGQIEAAYSQGYPVEQAASVEDFLSEEAYLEWLQHQNVTQAVSGYTRKISGAVTQVLSLPDGYADPVGRIARLTLSADTVDELISMELVPGQQYIVYGMDYVDEYWKLIGRLNADRSRDYLFDQPFNPDWAVLVPEDEKVWWQSHGPETNDRFRYQYACYRTIVLFESEYLQLNAISMTLREPVDSIEYVEIRENGDGHLLVLVPTKEVTYQDASGQTVTVSPEEYTATYQVPTIAPLEGSAEDFLQSAQGADWQAALERDAVNNHAFAVMGVDKLGYLADFALQKARIVQGRDFTEEELETGARVCVIPEELALANGLSVGDTITANFYTTDHALPYQDFRTEDKGIVSPTASFYFETTPITETAEYTIVGLCKGEAAFPDVTENPYAFSANTLFVPQTSVQTQMEYANVAPFVTVVLENGKIEDFHALLRRAGYAGLFRYYDQNYSVIAANFHNYKALAKQILAVGIALYAVLLLLFMLLFPGMQKGNVRTMESLGAPKGQRFSHVLMSAMTILIPAAGSGCLIGSLLWGYVLKALQASAESVVALQSEPGVLAVVAGAQLMLGLLISVTLAVILATPKSRLGRR